MSKKENINETVENEEVIEQVEKKESKVKGFVSKVGAGAKKHGGKVLAVAGICAAAAIGYLAGMRKDTNDDGSDDYYCDDTEADSVEDSNSDAE